MVMKFIMDGDWDGADKCLPDFASVSILPIRFGPTEVMLVDLVFTLRHIAHALSIWDFTSPYLLQMPTTVTASMMGRSAYTSTVSLISVTLAP